MSKIVLDTDALIKVVRSGAFAFIHHKCFISEEVYEEAVTEGKKRFYEDSYLIESLIEDGKMKVMKADMIESIHGLGKGELSTLALFRQIKADVIISDDRKFLDMLEAQNTPFIVPTECIVSLVNTKKMTHKQGINALESIKYLVRKENYTRAIEALGGKP